MKDMVRTFKALSDPTRLRIILLLIKRELCVCELMFILNMEQSRISHQLRILRDSDLVEDIRDGKWITYRVNEKIRRSLKLLFDEFLKGKFVTSKEIEQDGKRLVTCLKREIRKKKQSN